MCCVGLTDALAQHLDRDRVGHERTARHEIAGSKAQSRLPPEVVAEQVSGRDVREPCFAAQVFCLSALARARCAEKHEIHGFLIFER